MSKVCSSAESGVRMAWSNAWHPGVVVAAPMNADCMMKVIGLAAWQDDDLPIAEAPREDIGNSQEPGDRFAGRAAAGVTVDSDAGSAGSGVYFLDVGGVG
jgi:hypothetical protein